MEEKKKKEQLQEKFRSVSDEDKEKAFNDALGIDLVQTKAFVNIKSKLKNNLKQKSLNKLSDEFDHIDLGMDDDSEKSVAELAKEAKGDTEKPEDKAATQSAVDLNVEKEEPKVQQVQSPPSAPSPTAAPSGPTGTG